MKNRLIAICLAVTFIFETLLPVNINASNNSIKEEEIILSNDGAVSEDKPEIINIRKEEGNIVINWLQIGNSSKYEIKINNKIYETNKNEFIYPYLSKLEGTTIAVREKIGNGFSNWSDERKISIDNSKINEELSVDPNLKIRSKEEFMQSALTNAPSTMTVDGNKIEYLVSVYGNFDGKVQWLETGRGFNGPGDAPIEKFKFRNIRKPAGAILKYQAYLYDTKTKVGAWQAVKNEGQEAGEAGKVITSIKMWLEGTNYQIIYNVMGNEKDVVPMITPLVSNGEEAIDSSKNIIPITKLNFDIIEGLPKMKLETFGDYNGIKKWDSLDDDKDGFIGPATKKTEKLKITSSSKPVGFTVKYQVYILENNAWQDWKSEGQEAGEDGKTITNIRAKIEGSSGYLIRYNFKGIPVGTTTYTSNYGLNGIEGLGSESNKNPVGGVFLEVCSGPPNLQMVTYGADPINANNGKVWFTGGQDEYRGPLNVPINKFIINLFNKPKGTTIKYQVYLQNAKRWDDWKSEGQIAGLDNDNITSIRIKFEFFILIEPLLFINANEVPAALEVRFV